MTPRDMRGNVPAAVPMRDMQIAMRHADPRITGLYDMAKNNKDRHASHRVTSFLVGRTGSWPAQPVG